MCPQKIKIAKITVSGWSQRITKPPRQSNNKPYKTAYIIKIAQTFNDHDINNINDSLKHLQKAYSKSKNRHFNNDAYHQDMLWSNDNLNLQKQSKKTTNLLMSQEEIDKILKEFDEQ